MPGMEITIRDVYDQQIRAADQLSQLRTEVAGHTSRVDERLANGSRRMAELGDQLDAHDGRLDSLESAADRQRGRVSVLQFIVSLAGSSAAAAFIGWLLAIAAHKH